MKRCMYCGQENEDSASSCVKCGNPLLDMPAEDDDNIEEMDFGGEAFAELSDPVIEPAAEPVQEAAAEEKLPAEEVKAEEPAHIAQEPVNTFAPEQVNIPDASAPIEEEEVLPVDEISFDEPDHNDVEHSQSYAAREQYEAQNVNEGFENNELDYEEAPNNTSEYGGEAYGYPQAEQEPYQEAAYEEEEDEDAPAGDPQIMKKSRKMVKSMLFFLAALIFTVSVCAELAYIVSGEAVVNLSTVTNTLKDWFGDIRFVSIMNSVVIPTVAKYKEQNAMFIPLAGIVLALPQLLIALGLWLAFGSISPKKEYVGTSGLTLTRVIEILKFIFTCFVLLAAIGYSVVFVVAAAAGQDGSKSMMSLILGIIGLLVVVILAVFVIMYYVQLIFSIRAIRTNVRTGESVGRIPGFIIFIGFMGCLVTVATMLPMAPDDYIGLAARGSRALWLLLITLWALVYRLIVRVKHN